MKRRIVIHWTPTALWTGAAILFGIGIAYTPALGNGSTWSLPYSGTTSTSNAAFGVTNNGTGYGISGTAVNIGISGQGTGGNSVGVQGSGGAYGVSGYCFTAGGTGVSGENEANSGTTYGVFGYATNPGVGYGVYGEGTYGVYGITSTGSGAGVTGYASNGATGVQANSDTGIAMNASSGSGNAINANVSSGSGQAIYASSFSPWSIFGAAWNGTGVEGYGNIGVYGASNGGGSNLAGFFNGNMTVTGNLNVWGTIYKSAVSFKIDHPLDPAHKYLVHACIESDEMVNLYRGNILLDSDGKATVMMPDWFQAENRDFSYQLTAIGASAPNLYVSREIEHNQFEIDGGKPGMKISWQVTGARNDAYANAHPLKVEVDKPAKEQGKYIRPEEFGQPKSRGLDDYHAMPIKAKSQTRGVVAPQRPIPATEPMIAHRAIH